MHLTRIELLQRMPVFGAIREDALAFLLMQARVVELRAGECFFREGEQTCSMFVLEVGRVAVFKSWKGRDVVLHDLSVGDCFGEMALMDLLPRSASVRADDDCRAIEINSSDLHHLYQRDAEQFALLQMNIGREVCRRLRTTNELLFQARMGLPVKSAHATG
ncbi:MAG: cyclic nucleotide-binding domain-containing protein [Burkholderiaceae bacterium]